MQAYYSKIYLILATVLALNIFFGFLPSFILLPAGAVFFFLAALSRGGRFAPDAPFSAKISLGAVFLLCFIAIIGTLFFNFYYLGRFWAVFTIAAVFLWTRHTPTLQLKKNLSLGLLYPVFIALASALIFLLFAARSTELIKSPWLALPPSFLPLFFASALSAIALLAKRKNTFPVSVLFAIFFGVAAAVYACGYGFDQFIHEAAQKYILERGTITPKTIQYIGFYSINIFINRIAGLSVEILDAFLLPALAALIAPAAFYILRKKDPAASPAAALAILLLPLSFFIVSTPQGLANFLLLIFVFLAADGYRGWLLPLAILSIHPISGIIAVFALAMAKFRYKKIIFILGAAALPAAFAFISYKNGGLHINFDFIGATKEYLEVLTSGRLKQNYIFWPDLMYLTRFLLLPAILAVSIFTAVKYRKEVSFYPLGFFALAAASFFATTAFSDFSYLINYEHKNYPERILQISFIFLAPYLILAADKILQRAIRQKFILKISFAAFFAFFITSNFYLSYPRWDNYENDKAKNTAGFMLEAVKKIRQDAGGKTYAVLTDQAVSAAALRLDGFKKYFRTPAGEVFYYPIPTGGPLYNEFLDLVYNNAGTEAVKNAKNLTGAGEIYVALPNYWENYNKIKENLKREMTVIFEDKDIIILKQKNSYSSIAGLL